jgi:hypothetical protein
MSHLVFDSPIPEFNWVRVNVLLNHELVQAIPVHAVVVVVVQDAANYQVSKLVEIENGIKPIVLIAPFAVVVDRSRYPANHLVIA